MWNEHGEVIAYISDEGETRQLQANGEWGENVTIDSMGSFYIPRPRPA